MNQERNDDPSNGLGPFIGFLIGAGLILLGALLRK